MQTFFSQHKGLIIGAGVVVVLAMWLVSSYNSFVSLNESVNTQWAQVETQYQRRFDLIPNLVASVQGVMKQETAIFTAIANARQGYAGARTTDEKAAAAGQMESALGRLLVITENYPQLKSSENVQSLMAQLEGTENRVSVERMRYNDMVNAWNVKVKSFPGVFVAKMFGFEAKKTFEADKEAASAPKVNL
jgi:LemA protein